MEQERSGGQAVFLVDLLRKEKSLNYTVISGEVLRNW